jgi:hypothetical protein
MEFSDEDRAITNKIEGSNVDIKLKSSFIEFGENDVILKIIEYRKPGDVFDFWNNIASKNREKWSHTLSTIEVDYVNAFTDNSVNKAIRMKDPIDYLKLTDEQRKIAKYYFGDSPVSSFKYANYETRRSIIAHYIYTHPASVNILLALYRIIRDSNPLFFSFERGWQIGSGKEMFTNVDASRLGAAGEFFLAIGLIYGLTKLHNIFPTNRPVNKPSRPLDSPIYDLPVEGGGIWINGRWYTEHALERMAPNTPQVKAELTNRIANRLKRIGITIDHPAYVRIMQKALKKIDPRGIPPSVVEAEIINPGSTTIKVITAKNKNTVVTVMPSKNH